MTKITLELVRKRAEHNDGELSTLEELSLHQQDIEKIEHLHRWCPRLRILYLQGNLIAKIENVGRLRDLEYLNLALNNLECVEGLDRCHALHKLDLTANFIYDLTSLLSLQDLPDLRELYLTGNPCTSYRGYRGWLVCNLPSVQELDGTLISRSERLRALQELTQSDSTVRIDQQQALEKRAKEKAKYEESERKEESEDEKDDEEWWKGPSEPTPEARIAIHRHIARRRQEHQSSSQHTKKSRAVRLFTSDGRPLNANAAKLEFQLTEDEDNNCFKLEVHTYKYLDATLVDCDVQPWYVRVTVRGKVLQLVLLEEVRPGQATALRSQVTGHLLVTMPKLADPWRPVSTCPPQKITPATSSNSAQSTYLPHTTTTPSPAHTECERQGNYLEVGESSSTVDYTKIVNNSAGEVPPAHGLATTRTRHLPPDRPNSPDFVDDADVPSLV
ncbi:dynein axonemal assembly factor 11-like [Panulirus ornatus]|uniref:dynein axonemal assembly factor 11-like n=1 Tax=Panulirus ornatus TaxID=150431 RepID=UPI003A889C04